MADDMPTALDDSEIVSLDDRRPIRTTLVRVSRDEPALLEAVLPRMYAMSQRMDGSALGLVAEVATLLNQRSLMVCVWAVIGPGQKVVGHALAQVKEWAGRWVAWVTQVEMDRHAGPIKDEWLRDLDAWIGAVDVVLTKSGAQPITECLMLTPRHTEAWARHAGFHEYRWLYRREVS